MALGIGDVVRLTAHMKNSVTGDIMNTFDVEIDAVGDDGNNGFKEAAAAWLSELYATIAPSMVTTNSYYQVHFLQRNGLEVLTPISWSGDVEFASVEPQLPQGTAALVYARTAQRHVILRKYLSAWGESANAQGVPENDLMAILQDFCDFWLDPYHGTNDWDFHAVCWPGTNTGSIPLIEALPSTKWAIQRRRRAGRGS